MTLNCLAFSPWGHTLGHISAWVWFFCGGDDCPLLQKPCVLSASECLSLCDLWRSLAQDLRFTKGRWGMGRMGDRSQRKKACAWEEGGCWEPGIGEGWQVSLGAAQCPPHLWDASPLCVSPRKVTCPVMEKPYTAARMAFGSPSWLRSSFILLGFHSHFLLIYPDFCA